MSELDVTKKYKPTSAMILLPAFQNLRDSNPKPMEDWVRNLVREEVRKALREELEELGVIVGEQPT